VLDYLTATSQMKVRFVAADGGPGNYVEAAVDDLTLYDAAAAPISAPPSGSPRRMSFRTPWPNPATGAVRLILDLPAGAAVSIDVQDLQGRRVRGLYRGDAPAGPLALDWDGRDASGREVPAGLYFVRATTGADQAVARLVRGR
jgi:hypothetical protein